MESLNSDNSLRPEQPSCQFYTIEPSDNMANRELPLLKSAAQTQPESQNSDSQQDKTQSDWVVEPNSEQQILVDQEFKKLLALNEELTTANNHLYEEVEHLKDDLAESEKALQWQKRRSSVAESMLNQQTKELAAAQEQIKSLFQELETTGQTVQRQENFIETYKAQLQISQQRLAQLERECSLLQTNYNEQSQQALQSENTCRELRSRLMRQQRQTLQFKAALEKCLETPGLNDSSEDTPNHQTRFSRKARSLFPNVQPIRPWSSESGSYGDEFDCRGNHATAPPHNLSTSPSGDHSPENLATEPETPAPSEAVASEIEVSPMTSESISSVEPSKLDDQLDSLIQMFFTADSASTSPAPVEIHVDSNQTETPVWETWATTPENEQPSEISPKQEFEPLAQEDDSPDAFNLPLHETTADSSLGEVLENYWLDNSSSDDSGDYANDNQSPSPVVYPQRPPKGRKSLSSVELPFFRPNNQDQKPQ